MPLHRPRQQGSHPQQKESYAIRSKGRTPYLRHEHRNRSRHRRCLPRRPHPTPCNRRGVACPFLLPFSRTGPKASPWAPTRYIPATVAPTYRTPKSRKGMEKIWGNHSNSDSPTPRHPTFLPDRITQDFGTLDGESPNLRAVRPHAHNLRLLTCRSVPDGYRPRRHSGVQVAPLDAQIVRRTIRSGIVS